MARVTEKVKAELQTILGPYYPDIVYYEYDPRKESAPRPFIGIQLTGHRPSTVSKTIGVSYGEYSFDIVIGVSGTDTNSSEYMIEDIVKKICSQFTPYSLFLTDNTVMVLACFASIQPDNISRLKDTAVIKLTIVQL